MRPVRLTLQAFGPYAGREVVDFRTAVAAGLFGVYGQTGAGKSTIFSAMSFALFGEPARAEQDAKSLRSDHAPADLPTEVEFVFELGERTYLVRRRPGQSRPKQRGEGETWDNPEAWVFDATGVALHELGEANSGKVLAEKKIGEVARVIGDLLGYRLEQFRQIVLLPQGKFETFLAAKTDERLGILRELFDVSIYRRLAAELKAEADAAERKVSRKRELCVLRLADEGFESLDALGTGIEAANAMCLETNRERDRVASSEKAARSRLAEAQRIAGLFDAAGNAQRAFAALDAESAGVSALAVRIETTKKAQAAQDLEDAWQTEVRAHGKSVDAAEEAARVAKEAAEKHRVANEAKSAAEGREGERAGLQSRLADLERYGEKLDGAVDLAGSHREAAEKAERARDAAQVAATVAKRLADAKEHDEGDLKSARAMEGRRRDAADQLQRAQAQLKRAKEAVTAAGHVAEARRVRDAGKETLERCEDEATAAKSALDETEGRLSRTQAIILAEKLVASEPCPVCGSHDHPAPAQGAIEQSGLTDTFRSAERAYAKAAKAAVSAATELAKAEGVLTVRIEAAARVEPSEGTVEALELEVESASAALDELGEPVDIQALEAQLDALTGSLKEAESERDRLRAKVTKAQGAEVEARALHAAAIAEVPAELRDRTSLDAETARVSRDLRSLVDAMSRARDAEDKAREIAIGATTDAAAATSRVEEVAKRRDEAGRAFLTRLASQGLDRAVYDEHKPLFDRIEADFKQVTDHRDRLIEAETRRRDASEAIKGLEQPDLPPLTLAVEEAGEALELALKEAADAQARSKDLARLQQSIEDTYRELETLEAETGPLRELAQRMDGKNEVKLDLETFAIGAMFDRVLAAANLRLQPMTQGRYRLERAFESGGRGRRGLEIQAHDINTGKSRPTSTLSGGETFIAALALALGLADVVESLNGKVRMDTIFIDEGFGSLDTENGAGTLDQVLQVLGTLVSNNRAVGLISHVSLVQEAIPNGFYVRHGPAGSHVEERGGF